MANVIASIMSVAGTLRHLTIETAGQVRRCFHDFGGHGGHERPVAGVAAPRVCGGWQNGRPGGHVARHTAIASSLFALNSASPTHPPATPPQLIVSQWAAALRQLRSACFIAADVHVKQGLGKLPSLTDLEFGSNNSELEIESAACLPPSVTHLSLEHCCLTAVPSCITRLAQVGSAACLPAHPPARLPARLPPRQMCRMPVSLTITLLQLPAGAGAGYISSQPLTTAPMPSCSFFLPAAFSWPAAAQPGPLSEHF